MQLMADSISVLGSRLGLLIEPAAKSCRIIRFDRFESMKRLFIKAGIVVEGREISFPLCPDSGGFELFDQRSSPCSISFTGVYAPAALKVKLEFISPFRPKDADFSTVPVLGVRLSVERLSGSFRWTAPTQKLSSVEIFFELSGDSSISFSEPSGTALDMSFSSVRFKKIFGDEGRVEEPQRDRFLGVGCCKLVGRRFTKTVKFDPEPNGVLAIAWCAFGERAMTVQGKWHPFRYSRFFSSLDDVAVWASANLLAVFDNAAKVDGIVKSSNCGFATNALLAYTLHSWLMDSWWIDRDGREWLSVWEGSCYFHSTVDVEYTQAPFYLAVWPELLGIELDFWPEYSKDGALLLGSKGEGTLFLSHDCGSGSYADGQDYQHDMEVEETANYLILAFAYWKRSGDEALLRSKAQIIRKYLRFLELCSTKGDGIPDIGVANTIDDASPAVQFGKGQVYLAVKAMSAFAVGAEMLLLLGFAEESARYRKLSAKVRRIIERKGWRGSHFATLLEKSAEGIVDPWTGKQFEGGVVPGWDAAHIYTPNGLSILDMAGFDVGLDGAKISQDIVEAARLCMSEYGCVHSSYSNEACGEVKAGLAGAAATPGWVSMNMLRDLAALYRGIDFRQHSERYWSWQTTSNTQEAKCFFETFKGNNLCFYPRGVAIWGVFDALAGLSVDAPRGIVRSAPAISQISVPRLFDADWKSGSCKTISN